MSTTKPDAPKPATTTGKRLTDKEKEEAEKAVVGIQPERPDKWRTSIEELAWPPVDKKGSASVGRLLGLAKPDWKLLVVATISLLIGSITSLIVPLFIGQLIDATVVSAATSEADANAALNRATGLALLFFGVSAVFAAIRAFLYTLVGERVVLRLRRRTFAAIARQEIGWFDRSKTGELINRLSSDTTVIQNSVTVNISQLLRNATTFVGGIVILFITSATLTGIMLGVVPIMVIGGIFFGNYMKKLSKRVQDALAAAGDKAQEAISSIRTVRAFAQEDSSIARYKKAVLETYSLAKKVARAYGAFVSLFVFLINAGICLVLYFGGVQVIDGQLSTGDLTAFLLYSVTVAGSFAGVAGLMADFAKASGASQRIFQIIDRVPVIDLHLEGGIPDGPVKGHLSFDNVSFAYPSRPELTILSNVSLSLSPGKVVALVGPSGGGKSSIASLALRFYDPQRGSVALDGRDIKTIDPSWLRSQLGIVSQEPILFAESIADNIRYGNIDATLDEVIQAAKQANAHDFISGFTDGYDTQVGEKGVRLSGGQKQRVAIARAILKAPKILLLDEATSALDSESEHLVQDALDKVMVGRTTLVIAHRLSTVRSADEILVVEKGKIVERGTHDDLIVKDGIYKALIARQMEPDAGTGDNQNSSTSSPSPPTQPKPSSSDSSIP